PLGERATRANHPVEPPQLLVAPGVVRGERVAVVIVRLGAAQALASRVGQRVDCVLEPLLGEPLGLAGPGAETGAPEEALGLRLAERSTVNRRHRLVIGGPSDGLNRPFGVKSARARARTRLP